MSRKTCNCCLILSRTCQLAPCCYLRGLPRVVIYGACPVLLFTGLSLTERPAPMLFIGGKGVGGGRSGVSAERRKLIQKLRDGGFLPRAATVKPRWATEISFNGLTRRKWTRSCPLARPSRAFAFSQIPFAVSQTAQVNPPQPRSTIQSPALKITSHEHDHTICNTLLVDPRSLLDCFSHFSQSRQRTPAPRQPLGRD